MQKLQPRLGWAAGTFSEMSREPPRWMMVSRGSFWVKFDNVSRNLNFDHGAARRAETPVLLIIRSRGIPVRIFARVQELLFKIPASASAGRCIAIFHGKICVYKSYDIFGAEDAVASSDKIVNEMEGARVFRPNFPPAISPNKEYCIFAFTSLCVLFVRSLPGCHCEKKTLATQTSVKCVNTCPNVELFVHYLLIM